MYYFWTYFGVPNFAPFHFCIILRPGQLLTPFILFFSLFYIFLAKKSEKCETLWETKKCDTLGKWETLG